MGPNGTRVGYKWDQIGRTWATNCTKWEPSGIKWDRIGPNGTEWDQMV